MRALPAVCLFGFAACASAGVEPSGTPSDAPSQSDGPVDPPPDSPPAPVTSTLQQTTNTTVAAGNSVACSLFDGAGNLLLTHSNSWYRVFSLAEAGITGPFSVSTVTFVVEVANNEPPVTVKVGTYGGTPDDVAPLDLGQASFLATTTVPITNTQAVISIDAPISATIPANGKLIVEITSSDHTTNGDGFLLGTTNGPFQHTNYLRATTCGVNTPTAMASVCTGCGDSQAIIAVTGTH